MASGSLPDAGRRTLGAVCLVDSKANHGQRVCWFCLANQKEFFLACAIGRE